MDNLISFIVSSFPSPRPLHHLLTSQSLPKWRESFFSPHPYWHFLYSRPLPLLACLIVECFQRVSLLSHYYYPCQNPVCKTQRSLTAYLPVKARGANGSSVAWWKEVEVGSRARNQFKSNFCHNVLNSLGFIFLIPNQGWILILRNKMSQV